MVVVVVVGGVGAERANTPPAVISPIGEEPAPCLRVPLSVAVHVLPLDVFKDLLLLDPHDEIVVSNRRLVVP